MKCSKSATWLLLFSGVLILSLAAEFTTARSLSAQDTVADSDEINPFAVRESRDADILYQRIEERIGAGDYAGASWLIQEILDRFPERVYRIEGGGLRFYGYYNRCMNLLGNFPPEGVRAYREGMDRKAEKLFTEGRDRGDVDALREVAKRFFYSSYGPEALSALGVLFVERGDWREAAYVLEKTLPGPSGDLLPSSRNLALYALCLSRRGEEEKLGELVKRYGESLSHASVSVAGRSLSLSLLLAEFQQDSPRRGEREELQWDYYRAPSFQKILHTLPSPESRLQWSVSIGEREEESRDSSSWPSFFGRQGSLPVLEGYPFFPVVSEGKVFINSGAWVSCHDLYSGKEIWFFSGGLEDRTGPLHHTQIFSASIAGGILYANMEVPQAMGIYYSYPHVQPIIPLRKIFALDKETGKLLWSHVDPSFQDGETKAFLERLSIFSPPLVVGETLYAAGSCFEGKIHTTLCAFCARTGRLRWKTLVCTGQQELNMFGNPFKEYNGSPLTEEDDVLYFCSNLGVVAALDSRWGTPLWISAYETRPIPISENFQEDRERPPGWCNGPPVVSGEHLLVAPTDCDFLLAFKKDTGELAWRVNFHDRRHILQYLLGAGETSAFLVLGGQVALALDTRTGETVWRKDWREGYEGIEELEETRNDRALLSGRGIVTANHLILPTLRGLFFFRREDGRIDPEPFLFTGRGRESRKLAGNLLFASDMLLSTSSTQVNSIFHWGIILQKLRSVQKEENLDPNRLLEIVNIFRQAGEYEGALKALSGLVGGSGEVSKAEPRVEKEIFQTHLQWGLHLWKKKEYEGAFAQFQRARSWAVEERDKIACLLQFMEYFRKKGDREREKEILQAFVKEHGNVAYPFTSPHEEVRAGLFGLLSLEELVEEEGDWQGAVRAYQEIIEKYPQETLKGKRADRIGAEGIERLLNLRGRELYDGFEKKARTLFTIGIRENDPLVLDRITREFPNSRVREESLFHLGWLHFREGKSVLAIPPLRRIGAEYPGSPFLQTSLLLLARCYRDLGFEDSAREMASQVEGTQWKSLVPEGGPTPEEILEGLRESHSGESEEPPDFSMLALREAWAHPLPLKRPVELLHPLGRGTGEEVLFFYSEGAVFALHLEKREILWSMNLDSQVMKSQEGGREFVFLIDGTLVVGTHGEIRAIQAGNGKLLWKFSEGPLWGISVGGGIVFAVLRCGQPDGEGMARIVAIDLLSGGMLWEREMKSWYPSELFFSGKNLVVFLRKPPQGILFHPLSGEKEGEFLLGDEGGYLRPFPLVQDGKVLLCTRIAGGTSVRILELEDQRTLFTRDFPNTQLKAVCPVGGGGAVLISHKLREGHEVIAFDLRRAILNWRREVDGRFSSVDFHRIWNGENLHALYLRLFDDAHRTYLLALSSATGEVRYQERVRDFSFQEIARVGRRICLLTERGISVLSE